MSLRNRMLLLVSLLLAGAVFVTASILTWNAYQAMVVYMPAERLQAAIQFEILQALIAALLILLVGVIASIFMSRLVTRPVDSFQRAAASLQAGNYQPDLLDKVIARKDELGQLGIIFDRMA